MSRRAVPDPGGVVYARAACGGIAPQCHRLASVSHGMPQSCPVPVVGRVAAGRYGVSGPGPEVTGVGSA